MEPPAKLSSPLPTAPGVVERYLFMQKWTVVPLT